MRERRLKAIAHGICVLSCFDPGAGFCQTGTPLTHIPTTEVKQVGRVPLCVREFPTQVQGSQHWAGLGMTLVKAVLSGISSVSFGRGVGRSHWLLFDNHKLF